MTRLLTTLLAVALVAAGCGSSSSSGDKGSSSSGGSPSGGGGTKITMKDIKFAPASVSVRVGQKVTWTNDDQVDHNVKADSGASFSSQNFGSGGSYSFTPKKAGTIKYECTIHSGMTGTLTVKG